MTPKSMTDIAKWVTKQYNKLKRKANNKGLYVYLLDNSFTQWGTLMGYNNNHTFKSDLVKVIVKERKNRTNQSEEAEEMEIMKSLNKPKAKPSLEGRPCSSFTFFQCKAFDLNSESYF